MPQFQPYKGGDDLLWALTRLTGVNKHQMLTAMPAGVDSIALHAMLLFGKGQGAFRPSWDSRNNILTYAKTPIGTDLKYDLEISFHIAFGEVEIVGGSPAIPVLREIAAKVAAITHMIELECRRAKYIA